MRAPLRTAGRWGLAAAGVVLSTILTGCGPHGAGSSAPGASDVQVDTPALQAQKEQAGIDSCRPGTATTPALPALTLPCLGGGPSVDLDTLRGPLVINLWASNCGVCVSELPALQAFDQQYGDQVPVLGVDWLDAHPDAALRLLQRSGATYPQLADPGGTLLDQQTLRVAQANPQFVFVRADGSVSVTAGGETSVDQVKQLVEKQLGVQL